MFRTLAAALVLAVTCLPVARAQGTPEMGVAQMPFVTLDDVRLFAETQYGKALLAKLEAAQTALAEENRQIEADLAERERALTEQRPGLAAEAFRALAEAFNTEVERYRMAQNAKERALYQAHEAERLRFRDLANQVLAQIMAERGALAIIAEEAIVLGFRDIDITDQAIARMDSLVGDGSALTAPQGTPAPDPDAP